MRALFLAALATAPACVSITPRSGGTAIEPEFVSSLVRGKTTGEALRAKLGPPASTTRSGNGSEIWIYSGWRGRPATFGSGYDRVQTAMLTITLRAGVVADYTFTQSDNGRD